MVRNAKKKPISTAKMYTHFAVVTVAVTAVFGLLVDGETKKAAEVALSQQEKKAAKFAGEPVSAVITRRANSDGPDQSASFGPEQSFGSPMMKARGGGSLGAGMKRAPSKVGQEAAIWTLLNMTKEQWFALDPELRRQLTGGRSVLLSGTAAERKAAMERLTSQSRARSGGGGNSLSPTPSTGSDY